MTTPTPDNTPRTPHDNVPDYDAAHRDVLAKRYDATISAHRAALVLQTWMGILDNNPEPDVTLTCFRDGLNEVGDHIHRVRALNTLAQWQADTATWVKMRDHGQQPEQMDAWLDNRIANNDPTRRFAQLVDQNLDDLPEQTPLDVADRLVDLTEALSHRAYEQYDDDDQFIDMIGDIESQIAKVADWELDNDQVLRPAWELNQLKRHELDAEPEDDLTLGIDENQYRDAHQTNLDTLVDNLRNRPVTDEHSSRPAWESTLLRQEEQARQAGDTHNQWDDVRREEEAMRGDDMAASAKGVWDGHDYVRPMPVHHPSTPPPPSAVDAHLPRSADTTTPDYQL